MVRPAGRPTAVYTAGRRAAAAGPPVADGPVGLLHLQVDLIALLVDCRPGSVTATGSPGVKT